MRKRQVAHLSTLVDSQEPALQLVETIDEWLAERSYGPRTTLRLYTRVIRNSFESFCRDQGILHLAQADEKVVRGFMRAEAERGLAQSSLVTVYNITHSFYEWCLQQGLISQNPVDKVARPKKGLSLKSGFSQDEIGRLIRIAGPPPGRGKLLKPGAPYTIAIRDRAILLTALGTGARADELVRMSLRDIDWANKTVVLHGKGAKDRKVRLGSRVHEVVSQWLKVRYVVASDRLWLDQFRKPIQYSTIYTLVRELGKRSGVENCHPHRLRHTAATLFYQSSRDLIATQVFLGHSSIDTTMGYLRGLGVDYGLDRGYASPDELVTG